MRTQWMVDSASCSSLRIAEHLFRQRLLTAFSPAAREVCHSRSGPMRAGSPPSHQDRGGARVCWHLSELGTQCFAAPLASQGEHFSENGPCWSLPVATQRTKQVCVRGGRSSAYLPQSPAVLCLLIVSPALKFHSSVRQRTGSRISRGTDPARRGTQRRRQTVPSAISAAGGYLRAQPVRGCLSQSAAPSGESSVQSRLALPARNCRNRMRDPPDSRPPVYLRCSASEHPSSGSARRSLPAPVLIDEFSWQPDRVPWDGSSGRADRANRQYLRLRSRSLQIESGCGRRLLTSRETIPIQIRRFGKYVWNWNPPGRGRRRIIFGFGFFTREGEKADLGGDTVTVAVAVRKDRK